LKTEINSFINDNGSRIDYGTCVREDRTGKGRYDLISPFAIERLAKWYELGAIKYAPRNWEGGMPISICLDSLLRHAFKYLAGKNDEDHLAAIAWNAFAIMHYEMLMPELQDIPTRTQEKE